MKCLNKIFSFKSRSPLCNRTTTISIKKLAITLLLFAVALIVGVGIFIPDHLYTLSLGFVLASLESSLLLASLSIAIWKSSCKFTKITLIGLLLMYVMNIVSISIACKYETYLNIFDFIAKGLFLITITAGGVSLIKILYNYFKK